MDQALGLLTLLGRGPGIAVFPGAARRFSPTLSQINSIRFSLSDIVLAPKYFRCVFFFCSQGPVRGSLITSQKYVTASASTEPLPRNSGVTDSKALSTSFEKTCMRQIHCLDRPSALVNKGPYHAQGLFSTIVSPFFPL